MPAAPKPELPRLVEQVRLLLWLQMYFTLLALLAVLIVFGTMGSAMDTTDQDRFGLSIVTMIPLAILLAMLGRLVRRRWAWVYLVVVVAELAAIALVVGAVLSGLAFTIVGVIYAALTLWIVADLFRGQVLRYFFTRAPARA